jgi:hypothetical protein
MTNLIRLLCGCAIAVLAFSGLQASAQSTVVTAKRGRAIPLLLRDKAYPYTSSLPSAKESVRVSKAAPLRYGADVGKYIDDSFPTAKGFALEADVTSRINRYFKEKGQPNIKALKTGSRGVAGGYHHPVDVYVVLDGPGRPIKLQVKAGKSKARRALSDPKYRGMYIVTTKEHAEGIRADFDKKTASYKRRGIPEPYEHRQLRKDLKRLADSLPPNRPDGFPLTTNGELQELTKKAQRKNYYRQCVELGRDDLIAGAQKPPVAVSRPRKLNGAIRSIRRVGGGYREASAVITDFRRFAKKARFQVLSVSGRTARYVGVAFRSSGRAVNRLLPGVGIGVAAYTSQQAYARWSAKDASDAYLVLTTVAIYCEVGSTVLFLIPEPTAVTKAAACVYLGVGLAADQVARIVDKYDQEGAQRRSRTLDLHARCEVARIGHIAAAEEALFALERRR